MNQFQRSYRVSGFMQTLLAHKDTRIWMKLNDNDTWDLATSVGVTATTVGSARAAASSTDIINDQFGEPLAPAAGVELFAPLRAAIWSSLKFGTSWIADFFAVCGSSPISSRRVISRHPTSSDRRIRTGLMRLPAGMADRGCAGPRDGCLRGNMADSQRHTGRTYGRRVANLPIRLEHTVVRCWRVRQHVGINREMRYESATAGLKSHADVIEKSPSKYFDQLTLPWCRVRRDCVGDHSPDVKWIGCRWDVINILRR
jgi:hypothetical protein